MEKWKILKTEDVSPSKWLSVTKHKVQLPNGRIVDDYYVAELGEVAFAIAITKNKELVMVRQYKHAIGEFFLELPAGFCQKGKTLAESAQAELAEETGIKVELKQLEFFAKSAVNPTKVYQISNCYIVENVEINSVQHLDPNEEIEVELIPLAEVLELIDNQEIWASESVHYISLLALRRPELFLP